MCCFGKIDSCILKYKNNITGIILAGEKGTRMGTDKGFMLWNEKPFVQHSIDALKPLVDDILMISDHASYATLGYSRIPDSLSEAGLLSGIYSGLIASATKLSLILSCDVPLINSIILEKIIAHYNENAAAVVCLADNKIMPLLALYHKNCYYLCKSLFDSGE